MPKGSKRGGRVRDKWKDKQWIMVNAPAPLGGSVINYVPVSDINSARGRVIENTMYDILKQDPIQHQTKVFVQIVNIVNGTCINNFQRARIRQRVSQKSNEEGKFDGKLRG